MTASEFPQTVEGSADIRLETAVFAPASRRPTRFAAGDVIANRYRALRFIDRGGMGEVYEVEDGDLGVRVALKCVLVAHDPGGRTLARLRRELLLARKVTHPNVCRVFDLGFHVAGGQAVAFLTMDLLEGETLSARLARVGRLSPAEARPIVDQMVAGLEAVHAAGIIHRDFKTSNVILVDEADGRTRAVLTDFGVALAAQGDGGAAEDEPPLVGSPLYMSPEQVTGERLTVASDVYALGVVLFEMATGTLPFVAESAQATAQMRVREEAPSARAREPSLDPRWDRAICTCLARDPSERFATPAAVSRALAPRAPSARRVGAVVLAVLAAAAVHVSRAAPTSSEADTAVSAARAAQRVAVLPLQNASGEAGAAWLSTALAEMLGTELASSEALRIVPGDGVARALRDLGGGPEASAHVASVTGADLVVGGAYWVDAAGALRIDVALVDAASGRTLAKLAGAGSASQPFDLAIRTAADVRRKLGVPEPPGAAAAAAIATMPADVDAARLYAEGLALVRRDDLVGARDRFVAATAAAPSFPLSHSELADVQRLLGWGALAREEAQKALLGSRQLPRESQLLLEGRVHAVSNEWPQAAEAYGALFRFFPDDLEHGLRYARAVLNAGRPDDAFEVIASLRKLPRPTSDDARIDLVEAIIATKVSDYRRSLSRANDAIEKAEAVGSRSTLADALEHVAEAQRRLGDRARALEAAEDARRLYAELGNARGLAVTLDVLADLYLDGADYARASAMQEEALGIARSIHHEYRIAGLLNRIGAVHHMQGELGAARRYYLDSRTDYVAIHEREGVGHTTANLAFAWIEEGELSKARPLLDEALATFHALGARIGEKNARLGLALVAHASGNLRDARRGMEAVLRAAEEIGDPDGAAEGLLALARVERDLGDPAAAAAGAERALSSYRALEHPAEELDAQLLLGTLALDEGEAAKAEGFARATLDAAAMRGLSAKRAPALALALRARVRREGATEATAELARELAELAETDERAGVRADAAIALAERRARGGDEDGAGGALRSVVARAEAAGLVVQALDARLALVQWIPRERSRAAALAADARAKAYGRIARRAAALVW